MVGFTRKHPIPVVKVLIKIPDPVEQSRDVLLCFISWFFNYNPSNEQVTKLSCTYETTTYHSPYSLK